MIAIVNVSPEPKETGIHLYEVRVNRKVICEFTHLREEPLSVCLQKAANVVKKIEGRWSDA
jgi:hypothetical protein